MSAYPPALRSVLKAAPCCLMCLSLSYVGWLYIHGMLRHTRDHVPKLSFKSTKFERYLRQRQQRYDKMYQPQLNFNPNQVEWTTLQ